MFRPLLFTPLPTLKVCIDEKRLNGNVWWGFQPARLPKSWPHHNTKLKKVRTMGEDRKGTEANKGKKIKRYIMEEKSILLYEKCHEKIILT